MKINNNSDIIPFDVDDTIIKWSGYKLNEPNLIQIKGFAGDTRGFKSNEKVIQRIKQHHFQGHHVRIWSAAGYLWAERVVKALGLEQYVTDIETKPKLMYDDMSPEIWSKIIHPEKL